jgi:hypothetical protein
MNKITIIFTAHKNNNNCNSDILLDIFNEIKPDILFEEIPYELYTTQYAEQGMGILEIQTIGKYLEFNSIEQIPVDTIKVNKIILSNYEKIANTMCRTNSHFVNTMNIMHSEEAKNGFAYLNSLQNDFNFCKLENIFLTSNDSYIISTYYEWKNHMDNRDINMINNIKEYCQINIFNNAIFLVGSGHRSSILSKIEKQGNNPIWNTNFFET